MNSTLSRQRTVPVTCSTSRRRMSAGSLMADARTLEMTGTDGARIVTFASASAIASAAGCISEQWNGADTGNGSARRTPCAFPTSATRSIADLWPDSTTWVGSLSLATWHTSGFSCPAPPGRAAASATSRAASRPTPSKAAMAPCPTGTAFCIACPRNFNNRAVSAKENVPAAASAEYSPNECPATNLTVRPMSKPCSFSSTRMTASETAMMAGWAFSVRVSASLGPSHMMADSFWPSAASTSSNTSLAAEWAAASSLPMPTSWLPCPGNTNAMPMRRKAPARLVLSEWRADARWVGGCQGGTSRTFVGIMAAVGPVCCPFSLARTSKTRITRPSPAPVGG